MPAPPKTNEVVEPTDTSHAPVESRKKSDKKKKRELERKARRAAEKILITPLQTDLLSSDTEVDSPCSGVSSEVLDGAEQNLSVPSICKSEDEIGHDDNAPSQDSVSSLLANDTLTLGGKDTDGTVLVRQEQKVTSDALPVSIIAPPPPPDTRKVEVSAVVQNTLRCNENHGTASPPMPITKANRHKDWVKFENAFKVDGFSHHIILPDHLAHNSRAYYPFYDCPFEQSGTLDCPYHKAYCACIDPMEPRNDKYIVYAENDPCHIGPYNYLQTAKLMNFFDSQPETKDRLMLVDDDLYYWLYTEGRHWRVEGLTSKKFKYTKMPKALEVEIEDYAKGYSKGKYMKQVDQFHDLASKNERLRSLSCQPAITEELLNALQKKCESGPDEEAVCYCKGTCLTNPLEDDDLVECAYIGCQTAFFHRGCVEKLGYHKVTTWYCSSCERFMNFEAQMAYLWAKASHKKQHLPDFESKALRCEMRARAVKAGALLSTYCGIH